MTFTNMAHILWNESVRIKLRMDKDKKLIIIWFNVYILKDEKRKWKVYISYLSDRKYNIDATVQLNRHY